jgi:hypothetical protein
VRLLLYLGALALAALIATSLNWAFEHYRPRAQATTQFDDPRLSFRPAAHLAQGAVRAFRAMPAAEQQALREELIASTSTLAVWAREHANTASVLCLGERHEDATRAFIAQQVLPRINYQVLMLETSQTQLQVMIESFDKGHRVDLLSASLNGILTATRAQVPAIRIVAIDERQNARRSAQTQPSRESLLVARIRSEWRPGQRHTVLFGALHCRAAAGWMMHRLIHEDARIQRAGAMSAVVLARYREASAQVLMYLLEEIGLGDDIVVIPRVSHFPKLVQKWLPLTVDAFAGFDSALLFDDHRTQP